MLEIEAAAAVGRVELETIKGFANTDVRSSSIKVQTGVVRKSFEQGLREHWLLHSGVFLGCGLTFLSVSESLR